MTVSTAGRSGRATVPGAGPEPAVGRRSDLRQDPHRLGLRGVHHRRLLPDGRRLASLPVAALRPGDRRVGDGRVEPPTRGADLTGLVHHCDRGVQYLSRALLRAARRQRHRRLGRLPKGDSFDNAMAESFNGLYKWELIYRQGPWRGLDDVEFATMTYVDWFNHRRLHGEITTTPATPPRPKPRPTTTVNHDGPRGRHPIATSSHATRGGSPVPAHGGRAQFHRRHVLDRLTLRSHAGLRYDSARSGCCRRGRDRRESRRGERGGERVLGAWWYGVDRHRRWRDRALGSGAVGRCRRHAVGDHPRETRRSLSRRSCSWEWARAGSRPGREPGRCERSDGSWRSGLPFTGVCSLSPGCWSRLV